MWLANTRVLPRGTIFLRWDWQSRGQVHQSPTTNSEHVLFLQEAIDPFGIMSPTMFRACFGYNRLTSTTPNDFTQHYGCCGCPWVFNRCRRVSIIDPISEGSRYSNCGCSNVQLALAIMLRWTPPVLERLDFAVRHVASGNVDSLPSIGYSATDLWSDFISNPGGILKVGGSWDVENYPVVTPAGDFAAECNPPVGRIALIGHSAGGWISRIYLSERDYGGRCYAGSSLVHSLVTLGTPHDSAPGPAFAGIRWCNGEVANASVRQLAVGGTGFAGGDWGALTQGSYAFCCNEGTDGTSYDGDGVTPIQSSLGWVGAKTMAIPGTTHFCWSDVFGGNLVAPELTKDHAAGRSWYGSDRVVDQWAKWLLDAGS